MRAPVRTSIEHPGQSYLDQAVRVDPVGITPIRRGIAAAFNHPLPEPVVVGYERVRLRWLTPGPGGKLVPRKK